MADPVVCRRGTWTALAPVGFEQMLIQWGHGSLRIEMRATQPADSNVSAGIAVRSEDLRNAPLGLWPLRTGNPVNIPYGRPADDAADITVNILF